MAMDWFQQNAPQGGSGAFGRLARQFTPQQFQQAATAQQAASAIAQEDWAKGGSPFSVFSDPRLRDPNLGQAPPLQNGVSQAPGGFNAPGSGIIDPNVVNRAAQQATGGGQNGATNWGDLQSRLNPNTDIAQWVRDGFQAQGKTANDNDINTWSNYWNQWGKNDPGYFFQRFSTPDGGGQQAGAGGGFGGTGSLINKLPTAADLQANPGFQYAIDEAQRGMQNSAAAKGTLLNGRTNQAMTQNLANYALGNFYMPLANLGLQYNQANVGNLYNLANLGLSGSSVGGQ